MRSSRREPPSASSSSSSVDSVHPRKSNAGRKPKPKPSDPVELANERAVKRLKNTEAARRSRIKKSERIDSQLKRLEDVEEEVARLREREAFLERLLKLHNIVF